MIKRTFFAIVFVGRQGSSYLQALLDSHPDVRCEGELFAPVGNYFAKSGHQDFGKYIEEFLHRDPHPVVGFKMPWMSILDYPESWDFFRHHGYKLIQLTRDNLLDQYISMMLAKLNNSWRSDFGDLKIRQFMANFQEAEGYFRSWVGQNTLLRQALNSYPSIQITYEQLIDRTGILAAIDFLGLSDVPLQSRFKRQRFGRQSDIIQNYSEMKAHFSKTIWAHHFNNEAAEATQKSVPIQAQARKLFKATLMARLKQRWESG